MIKPVCLVIVALAFLIVARSATLSVDQILQLHSAGISDAVIALQVNAGQPCRILQSRFLT
jgi:hypothetical protein